VIPPLTSGMLLQYPNKSPEVEIITVQLQEQSLLYFEAVMEGYENSVREEIRLKIIELHTQLTAQKIINLGLEYSRQ